MKENLTAREYDILLLCAIFTSQKEVAYKIGLSVQHVKNTLQEVYWKLGVNNLTQATAKMGWLKLPTDLRVYSDRVDEETLRAQISGDFSLSELQEAGT